MPESLNRSAVILGALWCLAILIPAVVVASVLSEDNSTDQSSWVFLALLAIVAAYLLGGAMAGGRAPEAPFTNGAAATFLAFAAVQVVGSTLRLIRGEDVTIISLIFFALLAASFGTTGAGIGTRWNARTLDDSGGEPTG